MNLEIDTVTQLFTATAPDADCHAVVELGLILLTDPLALHGLVRTLFAGREFDLSNRDGILNVLKTLHAFGIVEDVRGENSKIIRLRFRAQPLLRMLCGMPGRDPSTGLPKTLTPTSNS